MSWQMPCPVPRLKNDLNDLLPQNVFPWPLLYLFSVFKAPEGTERWSWERDEQEKG